MKRDYILILLIISAVAIGLIEFVEPANNRYQSVDYNINDTMNDIMNGIALGPNRNNEKAGNLDAVCIEYTFAAAGTEYVIKHNLGRVPAVYILVDQTGHGVYYIQNKQNWTSGTIGLMCNTAGVTAKLIIF